MAAYIDGGLGKDEAERIAAHLLSCERCFEIYTETRQFLLEENVVRFPSARGQGRTAALWYPLAAMLLVGIGVAYFRLLAAPPPLTPTEMTASLQGKPGLIENFWVGPTTRGPGDEETRPSDPAAFQLGVQLVNLQVSLEANNVEKAERDILPRIRQVLATQTGVSSLENSFGSLSAAIESKTSQESLKQASQIAQDSRDYFDESYLDLGQWVETGRLAALAQSPSFFQQANNRAFLRRLRWNDKLGLHEVKLDPTTRESLDRISEVVSKSDLRPADYAELQKDLAKILEHYYPMS